ncbi:MAG TPA: SDR family oxidoreductase, partial [Opitutaceae bacterium]|nr:SDR family oxidoreductase [Opitutaceae bacterium]
MSTVHGAASASSPERAAAMRIFLTGASGLVGSNTAVAAERRGHIVHGIVGSWNGAIPGLATTARVDMRDIPAVTAAVLEFFPDAIINAAAMSEPARCETDPDGSRALNVLLPQRLAELSHHLSCRFVHISSEQVFAGTSAPYAVTDPTSPINTYGHHKVESEKLVHAAASEFAATVRAPLLLGNSLTGARSVHERLFAEWVAGRTVRAFTDEIRQPCTADNLADVLVELCERRDMNGVFHWAGTKAYSRHELAVRIARHFGVPTDGRMETSLLAGTPA